MPIDLTRNIDRFESEDLQRFTFANTITVPRTIDFMVFNTDGATLAPLAVQSGLSVTVSAAAGNVGSVGVFYVDRQLPVSVGFYTYMWRAWGSSGGSSGSVVDSLFTVTRGEFEVIHTEPHSFFTYGNRAELVRRSRQLVGRGDLTERDIRPHMEAADGWIDGKIGRIVGVPLSPVPQVVREMSNHGGLYFFFSAYYGGQRSEIPADVQRQWEQDNEFLDGVVEGKYALTTSGATYQLENEVKAITGGIEEGKPAFGRSDWTDQEIDSDIKDFEDDQRD